MTHGPLLAKLLSPTGFVLVAMTFALPFVVVSCDVGNGAKATATYTGIGLARGSDAKVRATPEFADIMADGGPIGRRTPTGTSLDGLSVFPIAEQPLFLAVAGLLLVGLASEALRNRVARATAATSAAGCAAIVFIYAEQAARSAALVVVESGGSGPNQLDADQLKDLAIRTGYGFWIGLAILLVLTAGNLFDLLRQTRQSPAPPLPVSAGAAAS